MSMSTLFSRELASRIAPHSSFEKGAEYFEDGAVNKIWKEGEECKAIVEGTRRYTVSISVKGEDDIKTHCTCPYEMEGACKHIVAAILAFAQSPALATAEAQKQDDIPQKKAEALLAKASEVQVRKFLKMLLMHNQQTLHDFTIFLQGPKETANTLASYQQKIMRKLDELDLDDLEEAWQYSGEDYYDGYYAESKYDEETLTAILDPFREEGRTYADNKNFAESNKIYQAIIEALREKTKEIEDSHADLGDWFSNEMDTTVRGYVQTLAEAEDVNAKNAGIAYLCSLFAHEQFQWHQAELQKGLHDAIKEKQEAEAALEALSKVQQKKDLSQQESSLLTHLYSISGDEQAFEALTVSNLEKNPDLALPLLRHFKQQHRASDIISTAERLFSHFKKSKGDDVHDFDLRSHRDIEIDIRRFLKGILDITKDYAQTVDNLEKLFLASAHLSDYKELVQVYKNALEKEAFLKKMEDYFTKEQDITTMFKVFKREDRKEKILGLVQRYKDEECFPDMVAAISSAYPSECFASYKEKIKRISKDANQKYYPQIAYHLTHMKRIGLTQDFTKFIEWIKAAYSRRYRLMEELTKKGL